MRQTDALFGSTLHPVAATLVHFGHDECARLLVLERAGFAVKTCGTSLQKLRVKLRSGEVVAVAVTEDLPVVCEEVAAVARATTNAPLILFAGMDRDCDPNNFDLVIQAGVHAREWLHNVRDLIERNRALQAESSQTRAAASELLQQSQEARAETEKTIANIHKNREQRKQSR